jgi:hypothetical protein
MARSRLLRPRRLLPLLVLALRALPLPAQGGEDDRPARLLLDPAQALPGRGTGEAVMGAREAFDRAEPQLRIGRRRRGETEIAEALPAQLAGDGQTLRHECDLGERVELAGNDNLVEIRGQCLGLSITGNGNQVTIEVVDDIRIEGRGNDVRWRRGFTGTRPNALELGGRNTVRPLAGAAPRD